MADPKSNPFSTDTVVNAILEASSFVGEYSAKRFAEYAQGCGSFRKFESPIEAVFWVWFESFRSLDVNVTNDVYNFGLVPQHEVVTSDGSLFRLDFAVPDFRIAIELDGHEFHERTKEQVAHRNTRDRKLQTDGWTVLHISGSELWRAPLDRVEEIYEVCRQRALAAIDARWRAYAKPLVPSQE